MQSNNIRFPVFIDLKDKNVLVVGGGNIATRRVKTLLQFECVITVVSRDFTLELLDLGEQNKVELIEREFVATDLDNIFLATATTSNREVNCAIGKLASEMGIYVSVADAKEESNFYFPAIATIDTVVIAIGSNGADHSLVANIAKQIRNTSLTDKRILADKRILVNKRGLVDKRILVTSPDKSKSAILDKLTKLGAIVDFVPTIDIVELDFDLPSLADYSWIVFTSSAGVMIFFEKYYKAGLDTRVFANNKFATVGSKTAQTLQSYGIIADFIPENYSSESLITELLPHLTEQDKLLLIRPQTAPDTFTSMLEQNKTQFTKLPIYKTEHKTNTQLEGITSLKDYDAVTFTSTSCVESFCNQIKASKLNLSDIKCAFCIGEKTANTAKKYNINTIIPKISTIDALVEEIVEHFKP